MILKEAEYQVTSYASSVTFKVLPNELTQPILLQAPSQSVSLTQLPVIHLQISLPASYPSQAMPGI